MEDDVESNEASAVFELTQEQERKIERDYKNDLARNQALLNEVVFILTDRLSSSQVKTHAIEPRIKSLESILDKCKRKGFSELKGVRDVVGTRVICLFRSDMTQVGLIISDNFDIVSVDDKLATENNPLGYLSVHYLCKIPARYQGPRYENTADIVFEVQVRTLCMHAWAAVSHYLDYKGDWDVPADLKRALSALSGLFYVADTEFEQFYAARIESRKRAEEAQGQGLNAVEEINFDTLSAFLRTRFSAREMPDDTQAVSPLVQEIKEAGYTSLAQVTSDIEAAQSVFKRYEKKHPPGKEKYNAIGVARISLALANDAFFESYEKRRMKLYGVGEVSKLPKSALLPYRIR